MSQPSSPDRDAPASPESGAPSGSPGHADPSRRRTRRAYLLSGRVQGVGFRWWTAQLAQQLGLAGTVENRADGRVELHVVGPSAAVAALEERLRRGPPAARVTRIEPIQPAPTLPTDFRITG